LPPPERNYAAIGFMFNRWSTLPSARPMKVLKEWIIVENITHNSFPIHSVKGCYKTRNKKNVFMIMTVIFST